MRILYIDVNHLKELPSEEYVRWLEKYHLLYHIYKKLENIWLDYQPLTLMKEPYYSLDILMSENLALLTASVKPMSKFSLIPLQQKPYTLDIPNTRTLDIK